VTDWLTIAEAAAVARVSPKRLRCLMADGTLQEGRHFTRPRGLRPRFKREALMAWLEGDVLPPSAPARPLPRPARVPAIDPALLKHIGNGRHGM